MAVQGIKSRLKLHLCGAPSPTGPATAESDLMGLPGLKQGSASFWGSESPGGAWLTPACSAFEDLQLPGHPLPPHSKSPCSLAAWGPAGLPEEQTPVC